MKNLKIYHPVNDYVRHLNRDHTNFYSELVMELRKYNNVTICEEDVENAHLGSYSCNLYVNSDVVQPVTDCEMVIENLDNGEFFILSSHDQYSSTILNNKDNPKLKKVLFSQFNPLDIHHHTKRSYHKYFPWIYFKHANICLEEYYLKRKNINNFNEKLFFRGAYDSRPIVKYIDEDIMPLKPVEPNIKYFDDLISHKVAFSVGGAAVGDLCYRDIEYLQLGIPFIKFEYITQLDTPLIPNYHYISIKLPDDIPYHNGLPKDRLGLEHHAKMIEKRYKEVINDDDFLNTIGKNGREYYENHLTTEKKIHKTIKQLNLY